MVTTNTPPSEDQPWAGDLVQLRPGTLENQHPGCWYVVGDIPEPGILELYLEDRHPGYWDFASTAEARDVVRIRRLTLTGARSWTLPATDGGRPR
ncbi:DUF6211 family protein [Streptomyces nanshensis]|uniref:Uncharacterized protein n=1 Tax=Streptomyces nanshensis TaxID=518642 RepID=A0A1E7L8I6_9ACTN|nr:DUF6211 family protein [Streptomyces nanshensis]OEV12470.1 hypothetical protein AN218_08120 [Streptomyces nanshensis]